VLLFSADQSSIAEDPEIFHMTLILTCLTKDYVVQASDRRISYLDGKTPPEDHGNKALVYENNFAFAFTGRARLETTTTIEWVAQRLSEGKDLNEAIYHLKDRATSLMKNFYSGRRLPELMVAFVGAGFAEVEENGSWSLKPVRIMVSNVVEKRDGWSPLKEFKIDFDALRPGQTFKLFSSGRPLVKERWTALNNILKWCLRHKTARRPETIGRFLAREILKAADTDSFIGKNVMCTFVPRNFINDGNFQINIGSMLMEPPQINTEPQQIQPINYFPLHYRFFIPPPFDRPRSIYVDGCDSPLPYYSPIYVRPEKVIPSICLSEMSVTIPPVIRTPDTIVEE
jgi:hypothetical protein